MSMNGLRIAALALALVTAACAGGASEPANTIALVGMSDADAETVRSAMWVWAEAIGAAVFVAASESEARIVVRTDCDWRPEDTRLGATYELEPTVVCLRRGTARIVAVHELGHALGLGHEPDPASVMYTYLNEAQRVSETSIDYVSRLLGL